MAAPKQLEAANKNETPQERRRRLNAERQKRYRDNQKRLEAAKAADGATQREGSIDVPPPAPPPVAGRFDLSDVKDESASTDDVRARLEIVRTQPIPNAGDPRAYTGHVPGDVGEIPPEPEEEAEPVSQDAEEGAAKFAAGIGLLVQLALSDAAERYGGQLPAELGAFDLAEVQPKVVGFVMARAHRCAIKWGINLNLPYEDELVTLGATSASVLYLWSKWRGELAEPAAAQTDDNDAAPRDTSPADEPDETPGEPPGFGKLTVRARGNAEKRRVPEWMAGGSR